MRGANGRSTPRRARTRAVLSVVVTSAVVGAVLGGTPARATDPTPTATPSPDVSSTTSAPEPAATKTPGGRSTRPGDKKSEDGPDRSAPSKAEQAKAKARAEAAEAARLAAEHAHDAAALVEASQALAKAQADLVVAQTELTEAERALADAKAIDAQAKTDLDAAVLAEERATRNLADVEARIQARLTDLGRLARVTYQSNGSMGDWAIVLASTTPDQLADRIAFLQSVGSAGNAVLADLAVARADLLNAQDRLAAARREMEVKRLAAATALTQVARRAMLARSAERQVGAVVEVRKAAFEAARAAALEDQKRHREMVAQSGALASRIRDLSAGLVRRGEVVRGTGDFVLPGTGPVTSPYGPRLHPILDYVKLHTGTDFGAGDGIVYAADRGVVLFSEYNVAYGNMTVVDHGKVGGLRITTMYAHMSAAGVEAGDRVLRGQALGVIGSTGFSTGPHLHFEVRVDGEPLDPGPFLEGAPRPAAAAIAGRVPGR
jgi:murein DD-endopeptidase MepM/ murein hydrolase activator NlpD